MRLIRVLAFLCLFAGLASAQSTSSITGTIKDLTGANVTSGQVTFELVPGIDTTSSGIARFSPQTVTCTINGSGLVKALDGVSTCTIVQNTSISPANTAYKACIQAQFITPGSCFVMYATTSSIDITTVTPTPAQMPAYNLVDTFSNQSIAGAKTFTGTVTFGGTLNLGAITLGGNLNMGGNSITNAAAGTFSGNVSVGGTLIVTGVSTLTGGAALPSGAVIAWNSDSGLSRSAAGVIAVGNGTAGNITGTLKAQTISLPKSDNTVPATIANDTAGGINLTTNSGKVWEVANGGNFASPLGGQLQLNGATSGAIGLAVPAIAGSNIFTIPAATDTAVGKSTTDTITNKTPGSPWNGVACGNGGADFCLPVVVGTPVHLTGINANVAATNVFAAPATGLYMWSCNCRTTTAGSGTTATFTLAFANEAGAQTFTSGTFALNSTAFATGTVSFNLPIHLNSGTAATFAVNGTWGTSVAACDSFLLREN